ncbi:hypothetical protein WJX73_003836 [Symbiochloris irregularis]|uniref:Methyltransferase FkbM domain-containing protein n=1 Tax=Symbiochloris irregularis TaxID=706552 RepID=A0AAW1NQT0_9CHLO
MNPSSRTSLLPAAILLLLLHSGQALRLTKSSHAAKSGAIFQKYRLEQIEFCKHQSQTVEACGQDCPEVLASKEATGAEDVKLIVYKDNDWVSENIRDWQGWETMGVTQMQKVIRSNPGSYVVDIGSNLGWYSLLAAAQGAPVLSIEPLSKNLMRLRSSICRNTDFASRMTLIPVAVGAQPSDNCTLYTKDSNQGNGMLECRNDLVVSHGFTVRQRNVLTERSSLSSRPMNTAAERKRRCT